MNITRNTYVVALFFFTTSSLAETHESCDIDYLDENGTAIAVGCEDADLFCYYP